MKKQLQHPPAPRPQRLSKGIGCVQLVSLTHDFKFEAPDSKQNRISRLSQPSEIVPAALEFAGVTVGDELR